MTQPAVRRTWVQLVAAIALAASGIVVGGGPGSIARAAGTPNIALSASTPGGVLYGASIPITLEASNTTATDGFNLSFQDVLPVGVSYVPGSASPDPMIIPRVGGTTALVWTNVSDLLAGTTVSLTYQVDYSQVTFDVDDVIATAPGAYVHDNARFVPQFDATTGAPIGTSYTGNDVDTTSTTLLAFELTKSEPNTEMELLRGVHDHQTVYTLRVDNNLVNPTTAFSVVDYLPAGLEFLGCGAVDNTTNAATTGQEYPTSGVINPGNAPAMTHPCPTPSSVTTVTTDPDAGGPMPNGVYTRVAWNSAALAAALGSANLAASGFFEFDYIAAIPLRQNVQATLASPTANLDNNTGTLTFDEQPLVNYAVATGTYDGRATASTDSDTFGVSAEDVSIHKSVSTGTFVQGSSSTWTLDVESSEYALSTGPITVTDTIPDGLDYVSSTPVQDTGFPTAGAAGTLIVQWTLPAFTARNSTATITFGTTTRTDYRATSGPVSANDSWTNTVGLATDATIITANDGTTSVLSVVDNSSAGQSAGGMTILKEVSEPVAGTLTCGDGTTPGLTFHPTLAGTYRPGDRVCWRLSVTFPGQLDTLEPLVQDYLPPGFVFDSWVAGDGDDGIAAASTFSPTALELASDPDIPLLEWDLGAAVDVGGLRFEAVVQTVITDATVAADGDILSNLMKFRYENTDGSIFQARDLADVSWAEPQLVLDKGVMARDGVPVPGAPATNVLVQADQLVTYQVRVDNTGSVAALSVDVRDVLPTGITCADVVLASISDSGSCDVANDWIEWPEGLGLSAPAGGFFAVTYDIRVPVDTAAETIFDNTAGVRTFRGPTNDPTPGNATFLYTPSANIDTTLEPGANADPAIDTARIFTGAPTTAKTRSTSIDELGNALLDQATIGETITYTVTQTLPGGTSYYGPAIVTDVLDATRLDLDEASLVVELDGSPLPGTFATSTAGNTVTITFPGDLVTPYSVPKGPPQVIVATFDAVVTDVNANVRPTSVSNTAGFTYRDGAGTLRTPPTSTIGTEIVEPNLTLAKTNDDGDGVVDPGQTIRYTLTVGNPTTPTQVSTAHDITVFDVVPADLIVLEAPGDPAENGDTIAPSGGTWDSVLRTISWTISSVAPDTTATLSYDVQTTDPLVASGALVNDAEAFATSLALTPPVERDGMTTTNPGYAATATDSVMAPTLSVAKSGTPGSATVGETITYTVDVTVPANVIAYDVTVIDDLPPGIAYESLTSVTCDQSGPCSPDITSADVTTDGDVVSFFIGDLTIAATAPRVVTIVYVAFVDDVGAATAGADLTNGATAYLNIVDRIAGTPVSPPAPGGFDNPSNTATDTVTVLEPSLTIDKDVAGQVGDSDTRRAKPGDVLTFDVVVTNASGAGVGDAHDITISDTPDPRLTGYSFTPVVGVVNSDADPSDGTLEWTLVGPLLPGTSVTITYQLTVPPGFDSGDEIPGGPELTNTADVPSYFGADAVTRMTPGRTFRQYGGPGRDVTPDTVTIELDLASIGDLVWFDVNGDGVVDLGEPRLANIDVTVTYLGANGVVGGGDDEAVTVSTDINGNYLVDRLPGGNYQVDVNEADPQFVAGLVPSYDLDGTTVSPNGIWIGTLGEAQDRVDVDFGYTGDGSIGDTIWLDQDGDGLQDAGEAGIAGVDVVVTWFGPNGVVGGGDDIIYPTATTDAAGNYLVDLLPAGNFSVAVQTGTLPSGYTIISDPQGAVDNLSAVTLTAGENDLDQDFGYQGSGSIGDTIYLDSDGNGSQGVGEPGLAGVNVELVHFGPDGLFGNTDDSTFTTTTAADGAYLFDSLPPGDYRVTVTGGLPASVTNSDDPDGGGDSTADLSLGNGADDLDQDFGYDADSVLGDRVWWDRNDDGVQDPGEPGLNGVTVTATGPNGLSFTTTTSGDGDYMFVDLPDGDWTVAVTAGVPAGFDPVFDADGGSDETSDVTLAGSDLVQDFGYAGDSSIGDRVWLDRNGDGVQDPAEPGLENLTVELTWYGPNGALGGGDDVVLTTQTDATGNYLFTGLPAGEYSVAVDETDPDFSPGLASTYDRDGTTVSPDGVTAVTLGASEDVDDVDFGYRGGGAIGDLVWFDRDGDGTQDPDEPGLSGIDVTLVWWGEDGVLGNADDETFTTVTDIDGGYLFDGLPAGTFDVTVDDADLPVGMQPTSDADGGLDDTSRVVLADGEVDFDQDFGYNGAGAVGDTVYLDVDGDGAQGPGEPGIPGQPVTVAWSGPDGPVVFTTVTDSNGNYLVDGLPDGAITITVVGGIADSAVNTDDPDGGGDSTSDVTIVAGSTDLDQDFGYRGDNAIGDLVWWDQNADGMLDGSEPGLAGIEITLTWFGVDGVEGGGDDLQFVTTTTVDGDYLFALLPDGSYRVEVTDGLPSGLDTATYDEDDGIGNPDGSTVVADLGVGDPLAEIHVTADFAFAGVGAIGDTVWLDLDGDGTQDIGEPGIPGVTVTLTWAGFDGDLGTLDDIVYTDIETDADGNYLFEHLPAGEFGVELTGVPAGLTTSADPDGGAPDNSVLILGPDEVNLDQDFGYVGDASIGDFVWLDVDADGVQDPGEPGLPGVTVTVATPGSDGILGTSDDIVINVVTDADGLYLITGLPGVTTTVVYDPDGLGAGLVPDSDLDGGDASSTTVDLDPGDDVRDVDFGVVGTAMLDGIVFDDLDGDGVQDPGEAGIPDVEIVIVWNGPDGPVTFTVTTDADGEWELVNIPDGDYDVTINVATLRDGDVTTTPVTVAVVVPAGGSASVVHGATPGASLGDLVWNDKDRDGVQDSGESGIAGVVVTLLAADGTVVATATTDAAGTYRFDDLVPGTYTVVVDASTIPATFSQTGDPDGTLDARTIVALTAGEVNLTADFGFAAPLASTAATGSNSGGLLMLAGVFTMLGAALVEASRRRRSI